jgi:predicted nucleic-acid-binding protein
MSMIGLDTNILARYYVAAAPGVDDVATFKQCEAARVLIDSGKRLMVSKTVVLELEWVLRGRYALTPRQTQQVLAHLLSLAHVEVEDKVAVQAATNALAQGFDFADALHHAGYRSCTAVATFDDKGFARRAKRTGLKPEVIVP